MAEFLGWVGGFGFLLTFTYNIGFSINGDDKNYGWQETVLGLAPIFFLAMLVLGALMSR